MQSSAPPPPQSHSSLDLSQASLVHSQKQPPGSALRLWLAVAVVWLVVAAAVVALWSQLAAVARPHWQVSSTSQPLQPDRDGVLRLAGSGSAIALMRQLVASCAQTNPKLRIDVAHGIGSGGGLRALNAGAIDAALVARPLSIGEQRTGRTFAVYAQSAVALASADPAASTLDGQALVARLVAPSPTWPTGQPLHWLLRETGDSGHATLARGYPPFAAAETRARGDRSALVLFHDRTLHAGLLANPGSVAVVDASAVRAEAIPLHLLHWSGMEPTEDTIASGQWPFVKPLAIVYDQAAAARLAPLLACLRSAPSQARLRAVGAVPLPF